MRKFTLLIAATLAACSPPGTSDSNAADPEPVSVAAIQGDGDSSPLLGRRVIVEATVSGDFQGDANAAGDLGGFYIQAPAPNREVGFAGIFVYEGSKSSIDVSAGDQVRVVGKVQEHFGETQLLAREVERIGSAAIAPVVLSLPAERWTENEDGLRLPDLEAYEGLLVRIDAPLTVTETRDLEAFGALLVGVGGVPSQFTNSNEPDTAGFAEYRQSIARGRLFLDDGQRRGFVAPARYLKDSDAVLRVGDTVRTPVTGNLRWSRGSGGRGVQGWRLMPTGAVVVETGNPRAEAPAREGKLRVAVFNVENLFTQSDNGTPRCGPARDANCRGADSEPELQRQLARIVSSIVALDADILALIELENRGDEALVLLANAVNQRLGKARFEPLRTGSLGEDAIRVGFLFHSATVSTVGEHAVLTREIDSRFDTRRNRPALLQYFAGADGRPFGIVVNHLKSKGSSCEEDGDPNRDDGQGNCNGTRSAAAAALADWLRTDPANVGSGAVLIVGDLNAYLREDPITTLENAGFTNLLSAEGQEPYSFVFAGQRGALDHALATESLLPRIVAAHEWRINADEPELIDYNLEEDRDPELFDPALPYRSSDHDPLLIDLN